MFKLKRVYEKPEKSDGWRVLIDRLWPRGLTKQAAAVDHWLKEIAPSDALRKKFHDDENWGDFEKKYRVELRDKNDELTQIKQMEKEHGTVTLLYGRKDDKHNQATVLLDVLKGRR